MVEEGRSPSLDSSESVGAQARQRMLERAAQYLGPEFVSQRQGPGGKKLTFLEGGTAIDLANRVFSHDGWTSEIRSEEREVEEQKGSPGTWVAVATTRVRVTVKWPGADCRETFHDGTGVGNGKSRTKWEALEGAVKEAETDGLKRALRLFGSALGNCFYDSSYRRYVEGLHRERQLASAGGATAGRDWKEEDLLPGLRPLAVSPQYSCQRGATGGLLMSKDETPVDYLVDDDDTVEFDGDEFLYEV